MERITYRITLNAHKNGIQKTLQGFETADNTSRRIEVSLVTGSETYEFPDNVVALIYITLPDVSEPMIHDCTIRDNVIVYDVQPITAEGITEMQVKLIEADPNGARQVLATPKFAVEVAKSGTDDSGAEQSAAFTALEHAVASAKSVYNSRLISIEIDKDCIFRAKYADGTEYESDAIRETIGYVNIELAKHYANVSQSAAILAQESVSDLKELADEVRMNSVYTIFEVDFETGELVYLSQNYAFQVNEETGELEVSAL